VLEFAHTHTYGVLVCVGARECACLCVFVCVCLYVCVCVRAHTYSRACMFMAVVFIPLPINKRRDVSQFITVIQN